MKITINHLEFTETFHFNNLTEESKRNLITNILNIFYDHHNGGKVSQKNLKAKPDLKVVKK